MKKKSLWQHFFFFKLPGMQKVKALITLFADDRPSFYFKIFLESIKLHAKKNAAMSIVGKFRFLFLRIRENDAVGTNLIK